MKFIEWTKHKKNEIKINDEGGIDPEGSDEIKKFKHADLITLPEGVDGTNCGNCLFIRNVKDGSGYCSHHEIKEQVTARMCCKYWDHKDVKRKFN